MSENTMSKNAVFENAVPHALIAAIPYGEGAYPDFILEALVRELQSNGLRVAGVIQHDLTRRDRSRCDMSLEDLTTGTVIGLSEDRGSAAKGCRIDQSGLVQAAALVAQALACDEADLLVINKFGKIESEGGGLREVMAEAVLRGLPIVVGVPLRNLDAWDAFAGPLAEQVAPDLDVLRGWLAARLPRGAEQNTGQQRHNAGESLCEGEDTAAEGCGQASAPLEGIPS